MSVRNLEKLLKPRSVALIGATDRPASIGSVVARNLERAGFAGDLTICPDITSVVQAPDLAVIVSPPETVPSMLRELGERGIRAAVVITGPG